MANICNTDLKITSEKLDVEKIEEIRKYISEEYAYCNEVNSFEYEVDDYIEVGCDTKWNVLPEALSIMAKKFEVDIRAVGREDSMGFIQVVKVDSVGNIISDNEIDIS